MNRIQHSLQMLHFRWINRLERIKKVLVISGGISASFDAQFGNGVSKAEAVHPHANGADNTGFIGVDILRRCCNVIAARSTNIAGHGMNGNLGMFLPQLPNFVVNLTGLHRTAAGTVDLQNDADRFVIFECLTQRLNHIFSICFRTAGNQSINLDQRGMPFDAAGRGAKIIRPR